MRTVRQPASRSVSTADQLTELGADDDGARPGRPVLRVDELLRLPGREHPGRPVAGDEPRAGRARGRRWRAPPTAPPVAVRRAGDVTSSVRSPPSR
ncbi:MAG: hypothetical protein U0S36_12140 [Candidatus Nanopelagicales bacterium]